MAGKMQLEDWLDDLCVRFIINLPQEDLSSVARICFQVEEAQWFYEDFIRPLDPTLPSMTLRTFCLRIFQHCPLLASFSVENHIKAFEEFLQYKTRVPVRGAIMLNEAMDSVVLVKGWKKGANWSFPRGKINKDEDDLDCAVREVYEETGLDLREADLVPREGKPKYIEIPMREQHLRLYVFKNVPMDTNFQPRTRKEISKIQWYKLTDLPTLRKKGTQNNHNHDSSGPGTNANKFYMVAPFLVPLKKWIVSQKKIAERRIISGPQPIPVSQHLPIEEEPTEDEAWASAAQSRGPPIDSLDGATRELQRLLNVQAQGQGAQPPPVAAPSNKASALLSLLQPTQPTQPAQPTTAMASAYYPQAQTQMPHTPLDHGTETAQPRNPHHQSNTAQPAFADPQQQYPPPHFSLPQTRTPVADWNFAQAQSLAQNAHGVPPQGQVEYNANATYPGTSASSQTQASHSAVYPQQLSSQPRPADSYNSGVYQGSPSRSNPMAPVLPYAAQTHISPSVSKQTPVAGHTLALLHAFKQEPLPPAVPDKPLASYQSPQASTASYHNVAAPSSHDQYSGQTRLPSRQAGPQTPLELAGTMIGPPPQANQHTSSLLDLFKKQVPNLGATQSSGYSEKSSVQNPPANHSAPTEHQLLAQLQHSVLSSKEITKQAASGGSHADTVSMGRLSLNNTSNQAESISHNPLLGDLKFAQPQILSSMPEARSGPIQPIRILQRGQALESLTTSDKPRSPLPPHMLADTQVISRARAPASSPGASAYNSNVSQEQKNQLLSLFGGQQRPPSGSAQGMKREPSQSGSTGGDAPKSRMASIAPPSRKGAETPISPADQSFLLGYLQSVTHNAGR